MEWVQISKHSILKQTEILQTQNGHWVTLQKGSTPIVGFRLTLNAPFHFKDLTFNLPRDLPDTSS